MGTMIFSINLLACGVAVVLLLESNGGYDGCDCEIIGIVMCNVFFGIFELFTTIFNLIDDCFSLRSIYLIIIRIIVINLIICRYDFFFLY